MNTMNVECLKLPLKKSSVLRTFENFYHINTSPRLLKLLRNVLRLIYFMSKTAKDSFSLLV